MTQNELEIRLKGLHNKRCQDLRGKKFGKLTPIEIDPTRTDKSIFWKCKCDCGKMTTVKTIHLTQHRVVSCGCSRKVRGNKHPTWRGCGDISQTYFHNIQNGAISRNLEFAITIEDVWKLFLKQKKKCSLSGIELIPPIGRWDNFTASIDRIDSSKGYVKENIQWIHKDINKMKQALTQQHFINLCKQVVNNQS
jgi:hypothetical protein